MREHFAEKHFQNETCQAHSFHVYTMHLYTTKELKNSTRLYKIIANFSCENHTTKVFKLKFDRKKILKLLSLFIHEYKKKTTNDDDDDDDLLLSYILRSQCKT